LIDFSFLYALDSILLFMVSIVKIKKEQISCVLRYDQIQDITKTILGYEWFSSYYVQLYIMYSVGQKKIFSHNFELCVKFMYHIFVHCCTTIFHYCCCCCLYVLFEAWKTCNIKGKRGNPVQVGRKIYRFSNIGIFIQNKVRHSSKNRTFWKRKMRYYCSYEIFICQCTAH